MTQSNRIKPIPISAIAVLNSRGRSQKSFKELVTSITHLGLKRPITVSNRGRSGVYELVYGEGRIEAFRALGQTDIPAIVVDASTQDCLLMSLIENIARGRHSPLELVSEIGRLAKLYRTVEIAAKLGLRPDHVRAVCYLLKHGEGRRVTGHTLLYPALPGIDVVRRSRNYHRCRQRQRRDFLANQPDQDFGEWRWNLGQID